MTPDMIVGFAFVLGCFLVFGIGQINGTLSDIRRELEKLNKKLEK